MSALVDALLAAAPDPATAVQRMIENAPDLSHALLTVNRYGAFTDREDRSTQRELLDEQTTTALVGNIRGAVRRASVEQLRDEPELRWLLSGLLIPDEEAGRAEVVAKTRDDAVMRALVRQSFGWGYSGNELGNSRFPLLNWQGLTHMLGHESSSGACANWGPHIEPVEEDERTAWELATRYAAGEGARQVSP